MNILTAPGAGEMSRRKNTRMTEKRKEDGKEGCQTQREAAKIPVVICPLLMGEKSLGEHKTDRFLDWNKLL